MKDDESLPEYTGEGEMLFFKKNTYAKARAKILNNKVKPDPTQFDMVERQGVKYYRLRPGLLFQSTVGAFFGLTRTVAGTFLQGGQVVGGSGTQTVSAIQVLNADGSPVAGDGNHLWLQCTGDGYTSDGGEVLLPGWDLTAVSTGIGTSVPDNTLPEVDAAEGCEVYVSIGTWSGGAFLPANMGNVNITHCPGAYTVTRDQA